jgi:uncharacterized YceG family protein
MTDYGRNSGSQPWHAEDPLYGDPYAAQQYPEQPQEPHRQQYPQHQQHAQQPYGQGQYPDGRHHEPLHDPLNDPGYGHRGDGGGGHGYGGGHTDPYGMPPVDPYATGQQQPVHDGPYDPYATGAHQQGHPQQHYPPQHRQPQQQGDYGRDAPHGGHPQPGPDPDTGWDAGPDLGEHAFFAGGDEDDPAPRGRRDGRGPRDHHRDESDGDEGQSRAERRNRRGGGGKRRSGTACLVVVLVLGGAVGAAGWFGYQFYEKHFGAAPDYSGEGTGEIQIEIPEGSTHSDMGNLLKKAGVVKSHDAFVDAANSNPQALGIHAGVYTLRKEMSAEAAVALMLDPASQNGLIVPEGRRATQVYELIDAALEEKKGTTAKVAKTADLGLPAWAEKDPEGFLFPAKYTVGEKTTPEGLLRTMVERATTEYRKMGLEAEARKVGREPRDVITIASLVQAEAQEDQDFGKVSRVIYNRLEQDMKLQFDSTINYAKGESKLQTTVEDTKFDSPYNTYVHPGLPPGPIDNPGAQAIEAALNPTEGNWLYFVSVTADDTRFTDSHAEHEKNVRDFNEAQRRKKEEG